MRYLPVKLKLILLISSVIYATISLATFSIALENNPGITVISSGEDYLTLEITIPPFDIKDVPGPDGIYQRILIDGWTYPSESGTPQLPVTGTLIPIPPTGDFRLEILPGTYEHKTDCRIFPVPRAILSDNGTVEEIFDMKETVYEQPTFYPGMDFLARLGPREFFRDEAVTRLAVSPFQWNPATGELRYYPHIRLSIRFENSLSPVVQDATSQIPNNEIYNSGITSGETRMTPLERSVVATSSFQEGLKIVLNQTGIYRITYNDLVQAGIDIDSTDTGAFRLFNKGNECSFKIVQAGSDFGHGDYIEFYGEELDTQYTASNVYWFIVDSIPGQIITTIDGSVTGSGIQVDSFIETLYLEENHIMWPQTPGAPGKDYWYWEKITAPDSVTYNIDVPSPSAENSDISARFLFQGRSEEPVSPDHHVKISMNGTEIGNVQWDGNTEYIFETPINQSLLRSGANTIMISMPGDTGAVTDVVYYNGIEITYRRNLEAYEDTLTFTVKGDGILYNPVITNLSNNNIIIYDITDRADIKEITNFDVTGDGNFYRATYEVPVNGSHTYYAATTATVRQPVEIEYWQSANLKDPDNGADYIIITAEEFLPAVEPLCNLRILQGLRVKAVSINDIFNEFSEGIFDPLALKDFLTYAYESWQEPEPLYILLVGDANIDYRDYFGTGKENKVPLHLTPTQELGLTPSDNWYACVKGGDVLPDMLIGRIPGADVSSVTRTINKIISYELASDYEPKDVLFVADDDYIDFENLNDELAEQLPPDFTAHKIYTRLYGQIQEVTDDIISTINQGVLMTNYVGHGDVTRWGGGPIMTEEFIFESGDIQSLDNSDALTFVVALDCLNGYFGQSFFYSLGEDFLGSSEAGAIASFSPSGLGYLWEHEIINEEIFKHIFIEEKNCIGSITTESKVTAYSRGVSESIVEMFHLAGDPATHLKIYDTGPVIETFTINAEAGSHGSIAPSGDVIVIEGSNQSFTITPDQNYRVADLVVDGESKGAIESYIFENISSNHTIHVTFKGTSPSAGGSGGGGGGCFIDALFR